MPLPLILGIGGAIAGATGIGSGISGAVKMKEANDTQKAADNRHKRNIAKFEECSNAANAEMDKLGELELTILKGFEEFSDVIDKIQNRPQFKEYERNGVTLPKYDKEELKKVSVGAGVLLGGMGGAASGTAGGIAAAGATYAAVMTLGTASTGTAIGTLSGAAATNATLAALGGGAISAGGGGIALGTSMLGAATLGVGLLVGGVIFNATGKSLSNKADEAWSQMKRAEETINKSCSYLEELQSTAVKYNNAIQKAYDKYLDSFSYVSNAVEKLHKTDWNEFSEKEKLATQNSVLLVGLLYRMCKVNLVEKAENDEEMNKINTREIDKSIADSKEVLDNLAA
ncbi:MAG: hypothetical protein NC231_07240 [Bacillus sp. (in: Bacteria)]|nr:hypothetical protein [Bacillus sp. (in: firmicutes)]MCM1426456.1 hypothetical protein [Eubacterium sp.]